MIVDGPSQRTIEMREIRCDPPLQLCLEVAAQAEKSRRRELHGSAGRKIGVGDDFQAVDGLLREDFRTAHGQPGQLHLR